jgi:hypothetical protein
MPASEGHLALQAHQAELLRALLRQGPIPAGFDPQQLETAAEALHSKRRRGVAKIWPGLTKALGTNFPELFDAYAAGQSQPRDGGPLADGRAFARWLQVRGQLPDAAIRDVLGVDLLYDTTGTGLVRRRGLSIQWAWHGWRLLVAVRVPGWGEWWIGKR